MFAFWCLVFWGTLWDVAVAWRLLTSGWSATAEVLLRTSPELATAAWGNRACGLLAAFVWVVVPLVRWSSSRRTA
jgi:hypothetical protein